MNPSTTQATEVLVRALVWLQRCGGAKLIVAGVLWLTLVGAQAQVGACSGVMYVHIPDPGLREAILSAIASQFGPVPPGDLERLTNAESVSCERLAALTQLTARSPAQTVRSLEGLEYATSLEVLKFWVIPVPTPGSYSPHLVESLEPLRNLPNLKVVRLEGRGELDLEPLTSLPMLDELSLVGFRVTDLEPLLRLEDLALVALSAAGIEDISILAGWERPPRYLGLQRNRIRRLSPLLMNPNIGCGHEIDVSYNCVAQSTSEVRDPLWSNLAIDGLRERGVKVVASP